MSNRYVVIVEYDGFGSYDSYPEVKWDFIRMFTDLEKAVEYAKHHSKQDEETTACIFHFDEEGNKVKEQDIW